MSSTLARNNKRGLFITVEGVEGAGKTTNIELIAEKIKAAGHNLLLTREPGGTQTGEAIREILISKELPEMHPDTELLLMFAARAEHLHRKIIPALKQGTWVLCDRFTDASYAYQGAGRGLNIEHISQLEKLVQGDLRPDYTLLFDLEADIGLGRAKSRGETDRFEQQHIDFFNRVRNQYLKMAEDDKQRYRLIHAQYDLAQVRAQVSDVIDKIIAQHIPGQ